MITLTTARDEPRADTRDLAKQLGIQHQNLFELVKTYAADFEQLALLRFQTGAVKTPGSRGTKTVKSALLTEDQCYLLLTYSRNTGKVRTLKVELVKAFRDARAAAQARVTEYRPTYRALHDRVAELAAGSPNARWAHANVNSAINKAVGIEARQRQSLPAPEMALTVVAQSVATKAMARAKDHRDGFQRAKVALGRLQDALAVLEGPGVAALNGGAT